MGVNFLGEDDIPEWWSLYEGWRESIKIPTRIAGI
jgi:hypothetical protein